ncbi:hypothetical protein ACLB2K_016185 [Fragaria x ananassa]
MHAVPQLLEGIRVKTMNKFHERNVESSTWRSVLCPKLEKKLSRRLETGRNWRVSQSSIDVFEVFTEDNNDVVNLAEIECSCGWWQFRSARDQVIIPIPDHDKPDPSDFGDSALQPPITRKPPERPKRRRIRSFGEEARPMQCQRCHQLGHHNSRSCTAAI